MKNMIKFWCILVIITTIISMPISEYESITTDIKDFAEGCIEITEPMIKHLKELIEFNKDGNIKGPSTDWDKAINEIRKLNRPNVECYYYPENLGDPYDITFSDTQCLVNIISNKEIAKKIIDISSNICTRYDEARKEFKLKEGHMKLGGMVIDLVLCIPKKYFHKKIIALEIIKRSKNISKEVKDELINNFDDYYLSPVYTKTYLENANFDYSKEVSEELLKSMTEEFDGYF